MYWIYDKNTHSMIRSETDVRTNEPVALYDTVNGLVYLLQYIQVWDDDGMYNINDKVKLDPKTTEVKYLKELASYFEEYNEKEDILWTSDVTDTFPDPYKRNTPPIIRASLIYLLKHPVTYMLNKVAHQKKRNCIREMHNIINKGDGDLTVKRASELLGYYGYSFEDLINPMLLKTKPKPEEWSYDLAYDEVPIFTRAVLTLYCNSQAEPDNTMSIAKYRQKLQETLNFAAKGNELSSKKASQLLSLVGKSVQDVFRPSLRVD